MKRSDKENRCKSGEEGVGKEELRMKRSDKENRCKSGEEEGGRRGTKDEEIRQGE